MQAIIKLFFTLIIVLFLKAPAWCHGVDGYITPAEGYLVTAQYDDGEPMSYASVEIKSLDAEIPFQAARTDRNGRIMFKPDRKGNWQVVVQDEMGHRLALDLTVEKEEEERKTNLVDTNTAAAGTQGLSRRTMGTIAGLSVIFGLAGIIYGFKSHGSGKRKIS